MAYSLRIVLVETSHPGNIGASARAMKTMGFDDLVLVAPGEFPSAEATARASGADELLKRARVVSSLSDAIADCAFVGDDLPDLPLLETVGVSISVANGVAAVQERCDYITQRPGGFGAVREICDLVVAAQSSDS